MRPAILFLFISIPVISFASTINGQLVDIDSDEPLPYAKVGLLNPSDSTVIVGGSANELGAFNLETEYTGKAILSVKSPGYVSPDKIINLPDDTDLGLLKLNKIDALADAITVEGQAATGQQLGDTVQFNAQAFKTNPDADAGDLVNKLPGISNDGTGLKAQGEEVKRVLVDGKEFFGNDPNAALKNIPAEAIQNVQVYDRNSDNAELTGVDDGESEKTINLKLKEEYKSGSFGNAGAGYGTDDRFGANAAVNYFNRDTRLSFLGNANNINRVNFTSEDLSGVAASQINGGSGRRRYRYSNTSEFMVGGIEGITSTFSGGVNYIDEWTEGSEISMSYLSSLRQNDRTTIQNIEYIGPDVNGDEFDNDQQSINDNLEHRISGRLRFPIDTTNTILFIPRFSWQGSDTDFSQDGFYDDFDSELNNFTSNENISDNSAQRFSGTLLLQHKFDKPGRTIQTDVQVETTQNNGDNEFINQFGNNPELILREDIQGQDINNNSQKYEIEIDYTEPLFWDDFLLTMEANTEIENSEVSQVTFDRTADGNTVINNQSSDLNVQYNRYGWETGFRYGKKDYTISITGEYRRIDMDNSFTLPITNEFERTFEAFTPRVFFRYNWGQNNIRLFGRRRNGLPSANQLNDAIDNSNPLSIRQGDSRLDQEMNNYLWANYNYFDTETNLNFFTQLNASFTENTIGNITRVFARDTTIENGLDVGAGSQFLTYGNLGESYSVNISSGLSKQIELLQSNANLSLNYSHSENPSIINGADNINNNDNIGVGLRLSSNISENVDFTFNFSPSYNITTNTAGAIPENDYWKNSLSGNINLLFWDGFVLRSDVSYTAFDGLGEGFDQQFAIWNGSIGYKFLEKDAAEISLYVFDILGQNQSINRNITETLISDESNNTLSQYVMLNFNYRIRNTASSGGERPRRFGR
jgi:hypothetical protein